ncbi:MAG: DNA polymerase I [Oscillospiraceae bacterium]|nr:DNA polymerase I [Oscillospiraceae bacterium]
MKLVVIDGNSIVNRAFYGVRALTAGDGKPTNAIFGFLNIYLKLIADEKPDALCVTFDRKEPTFRHLKYDGYKAQRKAMPEELSAQMPVLKEVLDAMNVPRYELAGWEADDLIGTIAAACEAGGWECVAVTGDKDSFQLIGPGTSVRHVKTRMGQTETVLYDTERFEQEYGFAPPVMVDLKALMGDSSDNIPGVPGVGEKTAMDLLHKYGSLEGVYGAIDSPEIKEGVRKKLAAGRESAEMSYDLATIRRDAPIDFDPEENRVREPDNDALYEIFRRLEFTKLTERFGLKPPADAVAQARAEEKAYTDTECRGPEDLQAMLGEARKAGTVTAVLTDGGTLCVIAGDRRYTAAPETPGCEEALRGLFGPEIRKNGYELKDLHRRLLERGIEAEGWSFDCALAAYLLAPTDSAYPLDGLCARYLGRPVSFGAPSDGQMSLLDERDDGEDARRTAAAVDQLVPVLGEKLEQEGLDGLLRDVEMPLCAVLAEMEHTGFLADREALKRFGELLAGRISELENLIYDLAGERFNINSPKQLGHILFDKLLLPPPKKTKTGYSTGADVLEKLYDRHAVIPAVLEYRQYTKLKSTYADGLSAVIADDGRIHTKFQMTVTATGRLSSVEPNLQNIPVRTELGGELRKMFIAGPGNVLVDADYSQIELRLLAHISGDEAMRRAFIDGEDIHAVTASQVLGIPLEQVTKQQRSHAKAVNFGIVYGISAFSLAQDIHVSVAEARAYMESYLEKYSGVREYMKRVVEQAKKDGYVSSLYGRRRALPELASHDRNLRAFGERVALNMPIQGTAADVMKIAMIRVERALKKSGLRARLLLQVHDELIVECPEDEAERTAEILSEEMRNAAELSVPLPVEAKWGKSWYEAK